MKPILVPVEQHTSPALWPHGLPRTQPLQVRRCTWECWKLLPAAKFLVRAAYLRSESRR
jgi:hypothetical protein